MRLGAFIVTFHRPDALEESLQILLQQTHPPEFILVVDNASCRETRALVSAIGRSEIQYEATGENLGSAGGTAFGTLRLAEQGYDLILGGDDDNPPRTPDTLERLVGLLSNCTSEVAGAGAVGARWDWQRGELRRLPDPLLQGPVEVDFIGAGHKFLLRREAVETVGPPDGRLFFGYPDLEHCLRLRRAGMRLLVDGDLMREYRARVGHLDYTPGRSWVPRRPKTSLWRDYYTTRNYIFMMSTTFDRPDLARRSVVKVLARMAVSWRRGLRYGSLFCRLQIKAIADGYRGRLGRTVDPRSKPATNP